MTVRNNKLYTEDTDTNALIPNVISGTSDMEKDIIDGELYVIDPNTNARIPVVEVQGGTGGGGVTLPIEISDVNGLQGKLNTIPVTVVLTQAEYDALPIKEPNTFYYVY